MMASREKVRRQFTWLCRPLADLQPVIRPGVKPPPMEPEVANAIRVGSYSKLPDKYPSIISTGRYGPTQDEINDQWFTVGRGSEDYSFKVMRRNIFEDALFKCEDERFELDININNLSSAISLLQQIQRDAAAAADREDEYKIPEKTMASPKLIPIRKVFAEAAVTLIAKMQVAPLQVIPVLVSGLTQKYDELILKKRDYNRIWRDICEKNYSKSLDHKSFYFKQAERKLTNTKGKIVCKTS